MVDAEQLIMTLLDRIEHNARHADKGWRRYMDMKHEAERLRRTLDVAQEGNRRHYRDMKAVEAKIAEWALYGELVRSLVAQRRLKELPKVPTPLETEIPF